MITFLFAVLQWPVQNNNYVTSRMDFIGYS